MDETVDLQPMPDGFNPFGTDVDPNAAGSQPQSRASMPATNQGSSFWSNFNPISTAQAAEDDHIGHLPSEIPPSPGTPSGPQPTMHIGNVLQMQPLSPDNPTEFHAPPIPGTFRGPPQGPQGPKISEPQEPAPQPRQPGEMATAKAADMHDAFQQVTGRAHGSDPNDLQLIGKGDVTFPPHINGPQDFAKEVQAKVNDVKQWNRPDWRYWYENSGQSINTLTGGDPNMADRVTATVAKTSQSTPVQQNAAYTGRAHNQVMVGEQPNAGLYPNTMGKAIQGYYNEPNPNVVGNKITGYQSGFRTWVPDYKNLGANDIWNMRWLGYQKGAGQPTPRVQNPDGTWSTGTPTASPWKGTPTTGQHNYDRFLRSAVTDQLNKEGFDGGQWTPGQVQAVGWGGTQVAHGVPADRAGADIGTAFNNRTMRLHYESAPGLTTNHLPEYHDAPDEVKQSYHDAINDVLTDGMGRDIIASHMGLLTGPTLHGTGVFQGKSNPGSAVQVVTGSAKGGGLSGYDPATAQLIKGAELTRGLLLQQDAVAGHYPMFPQNGLTRGNAKTDGNANLMDVRTGTPMTPEEGIQVAKHMQDLTGKDFFSPIFTNNGYRFVNEPSASGVSNTAFNKAVVEAVNRMYANKDGNDVHVVRGASKNLYEPNDWKANPNGEDYLAGLRSLGPDVQRRASELLATLGPKVSGVQDGYAAQYGWTPNPATRVWETNPAYHGFDTSQIKPGVMPRPWDGSKKSFNQSLLNPPAPGAQAAQGNSDAQLAAAMRALAGTREESAKSAADSAFLWNKAGDWDQSQGVPLPKDTKGLSKTDINEFLNYGE